MQIERVPKVEVTFESGSELEMLGHACASLLREKRNARYSSELTDLGLKAIQACTVGSEPRILSLTGREATVALASISDWVHSEAYDPEIQPASYRSSLEVARAIEASQLRSSEPDDEFGQDR